MAHTATSQLAPGRGKPGKELRKAQSKGFRLLGHCDFGHPHKGDVMQILIKEDYLLCGHIGLSRAGVSVLDVSNSQNPRVVNQIPAPPNTHHTKLQISGDIMIVNNEKWGEGGPWKAGIDVYDISHLPELRHISFFPVGGAGVHRMWFADGRYAYLPAGDDDFDGQLLVIVDLADPAHPKEAGRWWVPGMRKDEERDWYQMTSHRKDRKGQYVETEGIPPGLKPLRVTLHMPMATDDRVYCAWWDAGFIILDTSDISSPQVVSHTQYPPEESQSTHSPLVIPERNLCVVVDEFIAYDCSDMEKKIRVYDISDERNPAVLSVLPTPEGDFIERGGRFGPHNLHENRPGSLIDTDHIYQCYFNAGLRVYDISDPRNPFEMAYYVPATPNREPLRIWDAFEVVQIQVDDVYVATDGRVFLSERLGGGVWVLEKKF